MNAAKRAGMAVLLGAPGALILYFSLRDGGFFPGAQAFVSVLLLVALAARVTFTEHPFAGWGPGVGLAAGGLALYALWALASGYWSDSPARALLEFNRALPYLVAVVLFGSLPRSTEKLERMVWGVALAFGVVALIGLSTRLLPDRFPTATNLANERLSYPLTYWNALGLLAALGLILCLHLACRARGPVSVRVLGAAALPMLATTTFFTFSRGAIVAGAIGVVAYLLIGRPRGIVSGLVATVPFTVIAVKVAYGADALATTDPTSTAGIEQGAHVARVLVLCMVAAALVRLTLVLLDRRVARIRIADRTRRQVLRPLAAGVAVAVVLTAVAAGAPAYLDRQYDRFARGDQAPAQGDFRERLSDPASPARQRQWRVAADDFQTAELVGVGAGTYQLAWERRRPDPSTVVDAHSLYIEVLGELGIVGFVLIVGAIVAILAGFLMRARGPNRPLYAALFAGGLAWALHAGVDWDWEMPAVTLWFFALGGAVLARSRRKSEHRERLLNPYARLVAGLAVLALTAVPVMISMSEHRLNNARAAFLVEDCETASREAESAISILGVRPQPYEVLAYCDIRRGEPGDAVNQMRKAVDRDPNSWSYRYSLAVARGAAGLDPRREAKRAMRLNPLDPLTEDLVKRFDTDTRRTWIREARVVARSLVTL